MITVPRLPDSANPQNLKKLVEQFAEWDGLRAAAPHVRRNLSVIRKFVKGQRIRSVRGITVQAIQQHLSAARKQGLAPKTLLGMLGSVSAFCRFLQGRDLIGRNPCRLVPRPAVPKQLPIFLTNQEVKKALRLATACGIYAEVCIALNTGLRMTELRLLRWEDIDFGRRALLVRVSKNGRPRTVWLNEAATAALQEQRKAYRQSDYVFPGGHARRGHPPVWDRNAPRGRDWWLKRGLEPLREKLAAFQKQRVGAVGRGWHLFRHTFASHAVQAGVSIYKVSKWLGHRDIATTEIYAHLAPDYDPEIEAIYEPVR